MPSDPLLKILLVEDSRSEAVLLQEALLASGPRQFAIIWVTSLQEALEAIARGPFGVILLDLTLPDSRGLETVERIQAAASAIPIIVCTGVEDEDLAQRAIRQGAQDYLVKGRHDGPGIARAIRYAIDRKAAEEALRKAHDELEERVRVRTAELAQTVDTLQSEVQRRVSVEGALRERTAQLRSLAAELTLVEQRERRRMAEVLHDHLQQLLVGAKFRLRAIERSGQADLRQAVVEVDDLITQCIEVSRSLTGELSPPILHEGGLIPALEWLVRWMKGKHGLTVALDAPDPVDPESEDVTVLLFQSVRELLFNVVKHAKVKDARVEVEEVDDRVRIRVLDEGVGFDPAGVRATGGHEGGFGLFSIHERLDLLGGGMEIESTPGQGSRFTLTAPLEKWEAAPALSQPPRALSSAAAEGAAGAGGAESLRRRRIRILLADDHMIVRQGMAQLLRAEADMEVVGEAPDGGAAVALARQLLPDVVIMDVSMPVLGGVEATRIIRRELPQVRVIGLSMFEEAERGTAILAAGASQYVSKSGPSNVLIAAIRRAGGDGGNGGGNGGAPAGAAGGEGGPAEPPGLTGKTVGKPAPGRARRGGASAPGETKC
jgi:DNA-binding NarL/FixJ family response regulator